MTIPELRWLQKEWIHRAAKLEWNSSEKFWTVDHFHSILSNKDNRKNIIPLVCIVDDNIAGYNIYKLSKDSYNVINLVVSPDYRRQGIGSLLIQNIVSKLETNSEKSFIKVRVRDTNDIACEFLENRNFKFSAVVKNCFVVYDKTGGTNLKQNAYEYIYSKY